jgi:hypothetical protein
MDIQVNFTKPIPNELYIDSFTNGNTQSYVYSGNNLLYVAVDIPLGGIQDIHEDPDFKYNPDNTKKVIIDANVNPDVAYFITNTTFDDRIFATETLIDGTTYEQITNPMLRDMYQVNYDLETNTWKWKFITRNPKGRLNDFAQRNRDYVNTYISTISSNTALMQIANTYLQTLDTFETTGKGSIPSWKIIAVPKLSEVPPIPQELILAFDVLP